MNRTTLRKLTSINKEIFRLKRMVDLSTEAENIVYRLFFMENKLFLQSLKY